MNAPSYNGLGLLALAAVTAITSSCATADCNDTATCPLVGDEAAVATDGAVEGNGDAGMTMGQDSGSTSNESGRAETGSAEAGSAETGSAETGSAADGRAETGSAETGGAGDASGESGGALDGGGGDAGSADSSGASDAGSDAATDVASDAACVTSAVVDYCASIPPLPAAPVIDGVLDCGPALVTVVPQAWSGGGSLPPGNSATMAAAWRPNGLYVFVNVTTPAAIPADVGRPPFEGAAVEVFVDSDGVYQSPPNYDNPGTIQLVVAAPRSMSTPGRVGEGYRNTVDQGPWASSQFGTFSTASGFVFEGFVAGGDLGVPTWAPASGTHVGFDISVDVSFTTAAMTGSVGHRAGQYFFHVVPSPIGLPYADPRSFCTPTLTSQ